MMRRLLIITLVVSALLPGCEEEPTGLGTEWWADALDGTIPVPEHILDTLDGVYTSFGATSMVFSDPLVVKHAGEYITMYSGDKSSYAILKTGLLRPKGYRDEVRMYGYAYDAEGNKLYWLSLGIFDLEALMAGARGWRIAGNFGSAEVPAFGIDMVKKRSLPTDKDAFYIIGHRGGSWNLGNLPASENSVELIRLSERYGCNAIEIDVQMTKDGVPVLFHDENMSSRLVNEKYFIGNISDYTLAQLKSYCTLKKGERIPTLREALDAVLDETDLRMVWLDMKMDGIVPEVAAIQEEYLAKAAAMGREVKVFMGLPSATIYNEYMALPEAERPPALCELNEDKVRESGADVWAPRWSLGLINDRIDILHAEGIASYGWTLDAPELIRTFIAEGNFDGMVTNYPSMVAYEYYIRH